MHTAGLRSLVNHIERCGACPDALVWLDARWSLRHAYATCPRGDWLLWLGSRLVVDPFVLLKASCACVRLSLDMPLVSPRTRDRLSRVLDEAEVAFRGSHAAARATIDFLHSDDCPEALLMPVRSLLHAIHGIYSLTPAWYVADLVGAADSPEFAATLATCADRVRSVISFGCYTAAYKRLTSAVDAL